MILRHVSLHQIVSSGDNRYTVIVANTCSTTVTFLFFDCCTETRKKRPQCVLVFSPEKRLKETGPPARFFKFINIYKLYIRYVLSKLLIRHPLMYVAYISQTHFPPQQKFFLFAFRSRRQWRLAKGNCSPRGSGTFSLRPRMCQHWWGRARSIYWNIWLHWEKACIYKGLQ